MQFQEIFLGGDTALYSRMNTVDGGATQRIREEYQEFRLKILLGLFFLGLGFGAATALPLLIAELPRFTIAVFWLYLFVYVIELWAGVMLLRTGWSYWFELFISSAMGGMGIFALSLFFILQQPFTIGVIAVIGLSWVLLSPVMWWWGSRIFCEANGEIKEAVFRSKRIDLERQTYSPYLFPGNLFRAGWARKSVALSTAIGGAAIGLSVYVSHLVNTRLPDAENAYGAFWGYLLVLLSVACISAPYHEWRWIHRWEKKTGRKIYVKEIIEYKRLQQAKKAEQN